MNTNTHYGTDVNADRLITITTATGAGTVVGSTGDAVVGLGERFR